MVIAQMDSVVTDIGVDAVKIGMIGSAETAHAVADYLLQMTEFPIIFDPVIVSTSGSALTDPGTTAAFDRLIRFAALVTQTLPELKALGGDSIAARNGCPVIATGGRGEDDKPMDRLFHAPGYIARWGDRRTEPGHTHGTRGAE